MYVCLSVSFSLYDKEHCEDIRFLDTVCYILLKKTWMYMQLGSLHSR